MKLAIHKTFYIGISLGLMLLGTSCQNKSQPTAQTNITEESESTNSAETVSPVETEIFKMKDSTTYADLSFEIELPVARQDSTTAIRRKLIQILGNRLSHISSYEGEQLYPLYNGKPQDTNELMNYYCKQTKALLGKQSDDDASERIRYIRENSDITDTEKERQIADIPHWEYDFTLKKIADTLNYVVFQSADYIYMGGAHGGISGDGCLTFNKANGSLVTQFVDSTCTAAIQPLLVKGLITYYSDNGATVTQQDLFDRLLIEGDRIPLPALQPYPTRDGLVFTYQQYEIASYADGMPNFTIPYQDIAPYLTPEAKKVCQPYLPQ